MTEQERGPSTMSNLDELERLLRYLWNEAEIEIPEASIRHGRVCDLFTADDPLTADIERVLAAASDEPRWDPNEEHCHKCGRHVGVVWTAPDELWQKVMGGPGGIRCIRCFDEDAEAAGVPLLRWVPQPADIWSVPAALDGDEALAMTMEEDGWEFDGDPVFGARSILQGLASRGYRLAVATLTEEGAPR